MTEIKLYKSPWKALKIFALTIPFIVIGIWMISKEDSDSMDIFMGWLGLCFFGLGIPVGLFHLFDRRPQIIINEQGLWDRTTKQGIIEWDIIHDAYPIHISGQKFISLKLDKSFEVKVKQFKWATKLSKKVGAQKVNLHLGQIKIDSDRFTDFILEMTQTELPERKNKIKNVAQHGI